MYARSYGKLHFGDVVTLEDRIRSGMSQRFRPFVNPSDRRWAKSAESGAQNDCVEVVFGLKAVRDTKNPDAVLRLGGQAPAAWAKCLKSGALDLPTVV